MNKTIIWLVTAIGLLPVTLLGAGYLILGWLAERLSERTDNSFVGDVSLGIGPNSKLHLATHSWPALVVLVGVGMVVAGLLFLLPRQPDRVRSGGFLKMESYMRGLLGSRKEYASVIVATIDGERAILVMHERGRTTLDISADRLKNGGQEEAKARDFFGKLGMTPIREYRSANGDVAEATCNFEFQLSDDPKAIAALCVSVFTNLFGVTDQNGLEFTYEF